MRMKAARVLTFGVAFAGLGPLSCRPAETPENRDSVPVVRGSVETTALATGRIVPAYETTVRSPIAGLVAERLVALGDEVAAGAPLVQIAREPTSWELIEAQRNIEAAQLSEEAAREYVDGAHLASWLTRLVYGAAQLDRMFRSAELTRQNAAERLLYLRTGHVRTGRFEIDTLVRAPVAGRVIDLMAMPGQQVIPTGAYQPATEIAVIADMDQLEFRGTVNEIDAGKLSAGMDAVVRIGALPAARLTGTVREVGLRARERDHAVAFDVILAIERQPEVTMRAGYSATADIRMERRTDVLVLPERVVEFRAGGAFVQTLDRAGAVVERRIRVGLSDGLVVEVVSGLTEGALVLERQFPAIE
jgi:HlyD family secretion protein